MKKGIALLTIISILFLSACGATAKEVIDESTILPSFGMKPVFILDQLSSFLEYNQLPNFTKTTPSKEEVLGNDVISYIYDIAEGVSLTVRESKTTDSLIGFNYVLDKNVASNDTFLLVGGCFSMTIGSFSGENAKAVSATLKTDNITLDSKTYCENGLAGFTYIVEGNLISLIISALPLDENGKPIPQKPIKTDKEVALEQALAEKRVEEDKQDELNRALLEKIYVSFDAQDIYEGTQKIVVNFKNNTDKIFVGNLNIRSISDDNKTLGEDTIYIDNLAPNEKGYALVYFAPSTSNDFRRSWSSVVFTDDPIGKGGTIDTAKSEALAAYTLDTWGGWGNEEFAASWYKNILKVEVIADNGTYYAKATTNAKKEDTWLSISNGVLQFKEIRLQKVIIYDEAGTQLYERTNRFK